MPPDPVQGTDPATETEAVDAGAAIDLLTQSIEFAESRIALVDNKGALVFTAVAAMFASLIFTIGELAEIERFASPQTLEYVALGGAVVLGALALGFQLQAIRPSRTFFSTGLDVARPDVDPYLMWPTSGSLETYEEFHRAALSVTPEVQLANLAATAFTTRQLVRLKYRHYRRAILFVKLLAAWTGVSVVSIGLLQALG